MGAFTVKNLIRVLKLTNHLQELFGRDARDKDALRLKHLGIWFSGDDARGASLMSVAESNYSSSLLNFLVAITYTVGMRLIFDKLVVFVRQLASIQWGLNTSVSL
jgi:hypothetical protein